MDENEPTRTEDVQAAVQSALAGVFHKTDDGFLTRWVAVAEIIDGDGERSAWVVTPVDAPAWDTLGLLHFAVAQETGAITAGRVLPS